MISSAGLRIALLCLLGSSVEGGCCLSAWRVRTWAVRPGSLKKGAVADDEGRVGLFCGRPEGDCHIAA